MADYYLRHAMPEQVKLVDLSKLQLSDEDTYFLFPRPLYGDLMMMLDCSGHEDAVKNVKLYTYERIPKELAEKLQPLVYHFPNGLTTKKPSLLVSRFRLEDLEKITVDILANRKICRIEN